MLYVALDIAARDARIEDAAWRELDVGRKELLLPLADDARLREAAKHVARFKLTQSSTRAYVAGLLEASGTKRGVRLTIPMLVTRVEKLRASLGSDSVQQRIERIVATSERRDRERAAAKVEELRTLLGSVAKALRRKR